jgi:hypothetical protein
MTGVYKLVHPKPAGGVGWCVGKASGSEPCGEPPPQAANRNCAKACFVHRRRLTAGKIKNTLRVP